MIDWPSTICHLLDMSGTTRITNASRKYAEHSCPSYQTDMNLLRGTLPYARLVHRIPECGISLTE